MIVVVVLEVEAMEEMALVQEESEKSWTLPLLRVGEMLKVGVESIPSLPDWELIELGGVGRAL